MLSRSMPFLSTSIKMDIMEALFGKESQVFQLVEGKVIEPIPTREANGAWRGPSGPANTRVSAVMVCSSLVPWSVAARTPAVYFNPWARYPLHAAFERLSTVIANGDCMLDHDGDTAESLFSLPAGWPFSDQGSA
jgi:hypothetical protein